MPYTPCELCLSCFPWRLCPPAFLPPILIHRKSKTCQALPQQLCIAQTTFYPKTKYSSEVKIFSGTTLSWEYEFTHHQFRDPRWENNLPGEGAKGPEDAIQKMGLQQLKQQMKGWGATSSGVAVFLQRGRQVKSIKYKDKVKVMTEKTKEVTLGFIC